MAIFVVSRAAINVERLVVKSHCHLLQLRNPNAACTDLMPMPGKDASTVAMFLFTLRLKCVRPEIER
jgi:hypothetical protein